MTTIDVPRRRILVCLAGLSPAVVTEAAYALAVRGRPQIIPDEIFIVTTSDAFPLVVRTLLGPEGAIQRLIRDYHLPPASLRCDRDRVLLLENERGQPLADIRTSAESAVAGEQIAALLQKLRRDPVVELHCSLAGGRKTMGALLACALQLVGRRGDHLYHVLVDRRFEGLPWFFYPSPRPDRRRIDGQWLDVGKARVDLTEIPIVRLGGVADALNVRGRLAHRAAKLQTAMDERFTPPPLELRAHDAALAAGNVVLRLPPEEFALYALYAWLRAGCRSCRQSDRRDCKSCRPTDDEIFERWRIRLAAFWRLAAARPAPVFRRLLDADPSDVGALENFREWIRQTRSRIARRLADVDSPFSWREAYGLVPGRPRRGLRLSPALIILPRQAQGANPPTQREVRHRGKGGGRPS